MYVLFLWGACLGSFLNVCIYRWPRGLSVVSPRSYCPNCKKSIPWFYNIPILSFIVLKGKAQCCHLRLSWQDFGVEVFSAIFLVLNFKAYLLSLGLMNTAFFCCLVVLLKFREGFWLIWGRLVILCTLCIHFSWSLRRHLQIWKAALIFRFSLCIVRQQSCFLWLSIMELKSQE